MRSRQYRRFSLSPPQCHYILYGDDRQIVPDCETDDIVPFGHATVRIHQLAEHRCRFQARQSRQINGTFRMPAPA
jgi:hypothetical protein